MINLEMIYEEFDNTLATDPFFKCKESTLVRDIHRGLLQMRQEVCTSIYKDLCELIRELPYPLSPDQTEALGELRKGILSLTNIDELVFRSMHLAGERMLNDVKETNEG